MAATTTLLGLLTPTQGTLSGTWGDTVNYGISDYVDIAIAGTLSFAGDGAITLLNTTGSASGNGFTTTTAQYMVIRITGTQNVVKVITGPSYSKLYMVDHAGATSAVTFKATGQSGVSIAVGEKAFVYFNGTDYVKIATSTAGTGTVTAVSVVSANGLAGTSSGGATPALTLSTSITGVLKGNGTAISAAVSGTDYAPATSGAAILYGNGAGGFSNVTIGSGVSFAGGTLSATGSGGSVTSVAVSGGTTGLTTSGGPITTSGTITLAGTLATANGGTNLTSFTSGGVVYASSTSALATGSSLNFNGTTTLSVSSSLSGASNYMRVINSSNTANSGAFLSLQTGGTSGGTAAIEYYNQTTAIYAGATTSYASYFVGTNPAGTTSYFSASSTGLAVTGSLSSTTGANFATSSGNVSIGTTANPNSRKLSVNGIISVQDGTTEQAFIYYTGSATQWVSSNTPQQFWVNGMQRFVHGTAGQFGIGATPDYGTAGQVLTSGGASAAPTWAAAAGGGSQAFVAFGSTGGY